MSIDRSRGPVVSRWRRFGKDRLYVRLPAFEGAAEVEVGWFDLVSGQAQPASAENVALLDSVVRAWLAEHPADWPAAGPAREGIEATEPPLESPPDSSTTSADSVAPLAPSAPESPWLDLAQNQPGESVRREALAKREQAPVKTALARVLGVHTNERAWRIGADGEQKVAARIAVAQKRDPRWRVLHSIPVGARGSDIDHLLIGPGGVFTLNAKHHPDAKIWVGGNTFMVNGVKQPYVRNSRHEAVRASKLLTSACGFPVPVLGVVVIVGALIHDITIKVQPEDVWVTWRKNLPGWMGRLGTVLDDTAIEAIYEQARRSTTWAA